MINWIILSGLPASGKTSWAQNFRATYKNLCKEEQFCRIISIDNIKTDGNLQLGLPGNYYLYSDTYVILDGLFLTSDSIIDVLMKIPSSVIKSVTIIHWAEDREACLFNDIARRGQSSKYSIKTMAIEKPDIEKIKESTGIKEIKLKIKKVKKYPVKLNNGCICSPIYETGINNDIPEEFFHMEELDILIRQEYPYLTYKDYIDYIRPLIKIRKKQSFDYYSGTTYQYYYSVNYNLLKNTIEQIYNR